MTSVGSFIKQIPVNDGYFRPIPTLTQGSNVVQFMYSFTAGVGPTAFVPQSGAVSSALSTGACLLRDMGAQVLSTNTTGNRSPFVFRRVQIVSPDLTTDGVSGVSAGLDSDYNCAYIVMGFNGALPAGPFVRTG